MELTKKFDPNKYGCSDFDIGFYTWSQFLWSDGSWGKNVIIFRVDNSSSVHVEKKNKDILVLGEGSILPYSI